MWVVQHPPRLPLAPLTPVMPCDALPFSIPLLRLDPTPTPPLPSAFPFMQSAIPHKELPPSHPPRPARPHQKKHTPTTTPDTHLLLDEVGNLLQRDVALVLDEAVGGLHRRVMCFVVLGGALVVVAVLDEAVGGLQTGGGFFYITLSIWSVWWCGWVGGWVWGWRLGCVPGALGCLHAGAWDRKFRFRGVKLVLGRRGCGWGAATDNTPTHNHPFPSHLLQHLDELHVKGVCAVPGPPRDLLGRLQLHQHVHLQLGDVNM